MMGGGGGGGDIDRVDYCCSEQAHAQFWHNRLTSGARVLSLAKFLMDVLWYGMLSPENNTVKPINDQYVQILCSVLRPLEVSGHTPN